MGVAYLGLVYIIVYVGAIAILFLFVIMMLNLRLVELLDTGKAYTPNLPLGTMLGALFFFELLSLTLSSQGGEGSDSFAGETADVITDSNVHVAFNPTTADLSFTYIGGADLQIERIGQGLYTY
ncbi:hypothetical protein HK100_005189 [Physocladia obscura]|uniref:Uncharacterized protein n=1 Tax=Physocladia obscura TaxID=109957 RepID=A0AAD5SU66_9FUNG|nr:hypothetical protein HK100_005189 [Physocladia obscura]